MSDPAEQARASEARAGANRMRHVAFTRWEWRRAQLVMQLDIMLAQLDHGLISREKAMSVADIEVKSETKLVDFGGGLVGLVDLPDRRRWWHRFFR